MLVVATTWACWYVGIVALDGDYAFTVTNVIVHGVPYLVLTYRYGRARSAGAAGATGAGRRAATLAALALRGGVAAFLGLVVVLALSEEALWDRLVWHDRPWLFGGGGSALTLSDLALALLVPLLALPQATHYALDGFVWKLRGASGAASPLAAELRARSAWR